MKAGGIFGQNSVGEYFTQQAFSGTPAHQAAAGEYFRSPLSGTRFHKAATGSYYQPPAGCTGLGNTQTGLLVGAGTIGVLAGVMVVSGLFAIGLFYLANMGEEKPQTYHRSYPAPPLPASPAAYAQTRRAATTAYAPTRVMQRNKRKIRRGRRK